MVVLIECLVFCILFTFMVYLMSKNPIKTIYNYPPKIQEKVKSLKEYKNMLPTQNNKIVAKLSVSIIIILLVSLVFHYINGYTEFLEAFTNSLIIWTTINIYDVIILDICWFCRSEKFIFPGTEDLKNEYRNYWFHIKEGLFGELIGAIICLIIGLIVGFVL